MSVSFIAGEGSTATILITDTLGQRLRIQTSFSDRYYVSNFDADGDGELDSIQVTFTNPTPLKFGGSYGIFQRDDADFELIAGVHDYSSAQHRVTFISSPIASPAAYLGSAYRDTVFANSTDWIAGNDGNDIIRGGPEAQTLLGGNGSDRLDGAGGADVLEGGQGRDTLTGGSGADVFVFTPDAMAERDTVTDFRQSDGDRVDLSAFAGLDFVDAFTGTGPEVRARALGDRTGLVFDLDGDGIADARITFTGDVPFAPADLILPGA